MSDHSQPPLVELHNPPRGYVHLLVNEDGLSGLKAAFRQREAQRPWHIPAPSINLIDALPIFVDSCPCTQP